MFSAFSNFENISAVRLIFFFSKCLKRYINLRNATKSSKKTYVDWRNVSQNVSFKKFKWPRFPLLLISEIYQLWGSSKIWSRFEKCNQKLWFLFVFLNNWFPIGCSKRIPREYFSSAIHVLKKVLRCRVSLTEIFFSSISQKLMK